MENTKLTDNISEKLARGMEIAVEKCLLDKIVKGQSVVYAHEDGSIYKMTAKEALDKFLSEVAAQSL
ncbi:MAG: hypothetical protein NC411_09080 [Bacteroides sp.]|nr:hypothetical protein [Bacteroides sp.]